MELSVAMKAVAVGYMRGDPDCAARRCNPRPCHRGHCHRAARWVDKLMQPVMVLVYVITSGPPLGRSGYIPMAGFRHNVSFYQKSSRWCLRSVSRIDTRRTTIDGG
jgi:hypothetical protein